MSTGSSTHNCPHFLLLLLFHHKTKLAGLLHLSAPTNQPTNQPLKEPWDAMIYVLQDLSLYSIPDLDHNYYNYKDGVGLILDQHSDLFFFFNMGAGPPEWFLFICGVKRRFHLQRGTLWWWHESFQGHSLMNILLQFCLHSNRFRRDSRTWVDTFFALNSACDWSRIIIYHLFNFFLIHRQIAASILECMYWDQERCI